MNADLKDRQLEVAKQVVAVQRMYAASFKYKDEPHPSRAVHQTMLEVERAFAVDDFDRTEHLVKVLTSMIKREALLFAANPKRWVAMREELCT